MTIESSINSFFGFLGNLTSGIRGLIESIAADWLTVILLVGALAGGYWLSKRFPSIPSRWTMLVYAIIIFLIVRFI